MASINIKNSFAKLISPIELHCTYFKDEQLKMYKGEGLDCKVLSVMMGHFNSLKYFSFGIGSLWT